MAQVQEVIGTAAAQYANRPDDERFPSLQALIDNAEYDKEHSREVTYNLKDLHIQAGNSNDTKNDNEVMIVSPKGEAKFTHWSFGQLSTMLKSPAGFLRTLTPPTTALVMNEKIAQTMPGTTSSL